MYQNSGRKVFRHVRVNAVTKLELLVMVAYGGVTIE